MIDPVSRYRRRASGTDMEAIVLHGAVVMDCDSTSLTPARRILAQRMCFLSELECIEQQMEIMLVPASNNELAPSCLEAWLGLPQEMDRGVCWHCTTTNRLFTAGAHRSDPPPPLVRHSQGFTIPSASPDRAGPVEYDICRAVAQSASHKATRALRLKHGPP